jgi:DNA polymerase-3 subunit beta
MRCEIDRGVFAELLAGVANAVPTKSTYPVLANVMFEVKDGVLALTATDTDTSVRRTFRLDGKSEDGTMIIPARKLSEIVREIAAESIKFSNKDMTFILEAGKTRAMFSSLDPSEFPEMPKVPEGVTMELPLATWTELLDMVSFAAGKDDTRPAMTGVNWEVSKTEVRMVATDGHRLAFVSRKGKFPNKMKAIVAPKAFALFPRGEEKFTVSADPSKLGFVFQNTTIVSRALEGPFPDYERVIPKGSPARAVIDHGAFSAALRRSAVFAHPVGRLVAFEFSKGRLALRAEAPELGREEEEIECDYSGESVRIGFNVSYLLEVMRHIASDKVVVELSGPLSAGLFKPGEEKADTEQVFLLMPIRLD